MSDTVILVEKDLDITTTYNINQLYNSLLNIIKDNHITTETIVLISVNLMQIVEKYPNLSGIQKKLTVIYVLKRYVEYHLDGQNKENLMIIIDSVIPQVIDAIIAVDKKKIVINITNCFKKCFPRCFK